MNFTLITVDNIYHNQNVSSNRNETAVSVTCSHSAETVEFRYGFKLLRLAFRFQTLTVSVTVSHIVHAIQAIDNKISCFIICCLNCIRRDENSTYKTGLSYLINMHQ